MDSTIWCVVAFIVLGVVIVALLPLLLLVVALWLSAVRTAWKCLQEEWQDR